MRVPNASRMSESGRTLRDPKGGPDLNLEGDGCRKEVGHRTNGRRQLAVNASTRTGESFKNDGVPIVS